MPSCSSNSKEDLAGKPFPQNHHISGSLKGEKKLEQDSSKGRNYLVFYLNNLDEKEYADKFENDIRLLKKAVGGQD